VKNLLQQKLRPNLTALFQQKLRSNLTGVSNTRVLPVGSGWKAKAIGTAAGRKHPIRCKDSRHTGKTVTILKYIQTKRIGSLAIALAFGVAGSIPVSA
jgi:hypothetical protein